MLARLALVEAFWLAPRNVHYLFRRLGLYVSDLMNVEPILWATDSTNRASSDWVIALLHTAYIPYVPIDLTLRRLAGEVSSGRQVAVSSSTGSSNY